jgi:serine/threonine protein kinase
MAPEFLHIHTASFAADVYSLGTVLWEIWGGEEPWGGLYGRNLYQTVVEEKSTLPLGEEHRDIAPLLRNTFSPQPANRPSVQQVLSKLMELEM